MTSFNYNRQQGATLLVALVMLLILTVLAVSSMRGVVLESRITGNRAENLRLQTAADAALKEGEFRFFGPGHLRDKLEPNRANCQKDNKLNRNGANKPCLLNIQAWTDVIASIDSSDPDEDPEASSDRLKRFMLDPMAALLAKGTATDTAGESKFVAWMPYRGLDAETKTESETPAYWNTYLIAASEDESSLNPEYGSVMEGKGTYFYLVNGQAADSLALQSTTANIYVGLNN
ncbi:pilus assembly PilX family protein [Stutzerimonas nitrititolerans]|uniref:pilus assembly PilX family protein n=1 Tax=Stutzerimonas nitrititolerans TaxID=2482751 RepID=UPI003F804F07